MGGLGGGPGNRVRVGREGSRRPESHSRPPL